MGSTILYVEDEDFDVIFIRLAFRQAGIEDGLRVVVDGQQALDYMAGTGDYENRDRHPLPHVILLDLNLPLVSGFEVLEWIRSQPDFRNLPVVVFSSSARPEDKTRATQLGASDYIQKPGSGVEFFVVAKQLKERWLAGCATPE